MRRFRSRISSVVFAVLLAFRGPRSESGVSSASSVPLSSSSSSSSADELASLTSSLGAGASSVPLWAARRLARRERLSSSAATGALYSTARWNGTSAVFCVRGPWFRWRWRKLVSERDQGESVELDVAVRDHDDL